MIFLTMFLVSAALAQEVSGPAPEPSVSTRNSESRAEVQNVELSVGEPQVFDINFALDDAKQVLVGRPDAVTTTVVKVGDQRQLVMTPLKAVRGETAVSVRDTEGKLRITYVVRVQESNLERRKNEIAGLLKEVEGLEIKVVGQKIVVDGELLVPNDYARLLGVVQDDVYSKFVINLATLSPIALQKTAERIRNDVNAFAPDVYTRIVNGMVFLEGSVDSKDKADRAINVAKLYLPEVVPGNALANRGGDSVKKIERQMIHNFIVVSAPPPKKGDKLLRVTIHFVKLSKDYLKGFGFQWMPGLTQSQAGISVGSSASGGVGASGSSFTATISNLFPKLNSGQEAGYVKVLRTGTLIVKNGQPASLSETKTIPFSGLSATGQQSTQQSDVGVQFNVTPKIVGQSDDVELDVDLTQRSLDGLGTGGAPLISNHIVKTKLVVKSNESAAVAGVTSDDLQTDFNRTPSGSFDSNTEALFNLKRSKKTTKKKSQYVIFVTPQVIENAVDGTEDLKKNFRVKVK